MKAPGDNSDVSALIEQLQLEPHVEGGYFRRTFEASHREKIDLGDGPRFTLTSIHYLLTADSPIGRWNQNRSDIIHFHHLGGPLRYNIIGPAGDLESVVLGSETQRGHQFQLAVKGGTWKAAELLEGDYGLISEAVAPGFEYEDMSLGERRGLQASFPQHRELIARFSAC